MGLCLTGRRLFLNVRNDNSDTAFLSWPPAGRVHVTFFLLLGRIALSACSASGLPGVIENTQSVSIPN